MQSTIFAVYHYFSRKGRGNVYYIVNLFYESGIPHKDFLVNVYEDIFHRSPDRDFVGPFEQADALNRYMSALCRSLGQRGHW